MNEVSIKCFNCKKIFKVTRNKYFPVTITKCPFCNIDTTVNFEKKKTFKVGDMIGYVYGQPGNDTDYMIVVEVLENNKLKCLSTFFGLDNPYDNFDPSNAWLASEKELSGRIKDARDKNNIFTYVIKDKLLEMFNQYNERKK